MVTVCKQRFMAYEGLFRPQLFGKDTSSITDMVYSAVMACSIDSRKELCRYKECYQSWLFPYLALAFFTHELYANDIFKRDATSR